MNNIEMTVLAEIANQLYAIYTDATNRREMPMDLEEILLVWPYVDILPKLSGILNELDKQARGKHFSKEYVDEKCNAIKTLISLTYCKKCSKKINPAGISKVCDECLEKQKPINMNSPIFSDFL